MAILNHTVQNADHKVGSVLRFVAVDDSIVISPGADVAFVGYDSGDIEVAVGQSLSIILESDDGETQSWRLPNKRDEWPISADDSSGGSS